MAIVPYDPFKQLANLRKDFDRYFADVPFPFEGEQQYNTIRVDIHENDKSVIATFDVPGINKKEDITIDIESNTLSISGTIKKESEINDEHMYRKERFAGHFHRSITLPSPVSEEGVKASYKNGVLKVTMPKLTKENKTQIDVDFH